MSAPMKDTILTSLLAQAAELQFWRENCIALISPTEYTLDNGFTSVKVGKLISTTGSCKFCQKPLLSS